jgi:flagellar hook protein FlgE
MGIFDALTTAVSGLSSQSYALQNISGNIANSQTTAYKRIDTRFQDLIGDNVPSKQVAGGVLASSAATNNVQGDLQNAATSTFMALNGNGYFIVQKPGNFSGNVPVFNGVDLYTRRGDFQPDQNGYLVNGAGYYLMGIPLDPTTGNPTGSIPVTLQFSNNLIPAQQTSQIQYNANLPTEPITADTKTNVPGSNLLDPSIFAANPLVGPLSPAVVQGSGATVTPNSVTGSLALTFPLAAGQFVVNGTTINIPANTNQGNFLTLVNNSGAGVTASIDGSGQLVLTGNAKTTITLADGAPPGTLAALGLPAGVTPPTDLISAGMVSAGQELIVTIGSNPPQTITFGNGPPTIRTLAQLEAALQGLTGVAASTSIDNNGNIKIVASNTSDSITVAAGPPPVVNFLPTFGIRNAMAFPWNGNVYGVDLTNFLNESVAGGSITAYDATGTPVDMQFRWAKVDSASLGAGHSDKWNLFYQVNSNASNSQPAWTNVGTNFDFTTGKLTPPMSQLTLSNVVVNGQSLGNVALIFGSNGLTQYSNPSGTVDVNLMNQNGSSAGQLQSIAVDDQGRIIGTYSNGRTVPLAKVSLATFNGQNSLKQLDGGAYQATADSGPPLMNSTAKIVGSSLEASNSDIADEFSRLIVTQQAYSANTKIITTVNQMVQDLLNVVR